MRDIIGKMRAAVAPGQRDLDEDSVRLLNEATSSLLETRRDEAIAEYERFLGVAKRELSLPRDKLAARLDGTVILVTGGTGCIGSTLISQLVAQHLLVLHLRLDLNNCPSENDTALSAVLNRPSRRSS